MVGIKEHLKHSLQWRLIFLLSGMVTVLAVLGGAMAFRTAFSEAQDLQDAQLQQIALMLDPNSHALRRDNREDVNFPESAATLPKPRVLAQSLDSPYLNILFEDNQARQRLRTMRDGFHNFVTVSRHWRIYLHTRHHKRLVVAQRTAYRNRLAADSAKDAIWPFVMLMPLLWLVIVFCTRTLFKATQKLSAEVSSRNEYDLSPIDTSHIPVEIRPFVAAINRLFTQLQAAIEHDKRFIGLAAHELRTPITALTLQIARFDETQLSAEEKQKLLNDIRAGIHRTHQLLTQLLSMARAQHRIATENGETAHTALLPLLRTLYAELWPLAEAKNQDLGVSLANDYVLHVPEADLHTILKNLLENAIRYTPKGGRINVASQTDGHGALHIRVEDNGCGIAPEERSQVMQPFYRILGSSETGSGLGLAIVHTLCERRKITFSLDNTTLDTHGTAAVLTFSAGQYRPLSAD